MDFVESILNRSLEVREKLAIDPQIGQFVDTGLDIPKPYLGNGAIKLIIVGQDPTVEKPESRKLIRTVLNLDKEGSLKHYLTDLCQQLGISLENVYATNFCKIFFVERPTIIKAKTKIDVLGGSRDYWLPILKAELAQFPEANVVTLGEPLLNVLVKSPASAKVKTYWDHKNWQAGKQQQFQNVSRDSTYLERGFYPFCHQPSLRKEFYKASLADYIRFVRDQ